MSITPSYPIVLKVSHVHSSLGKVRLRQHEDFEDMSSVIALHNDYCTAEQYIEGEYDLRIQKIGDHVRVLKRTGTGQWKTNRGAAILEDVPVTQEYKFWIDEASKLFGGLDLCALDVIHGTDGKEFILELNDTSIGLGPSHEEEDQKKIRDLVIKRLVEHYSEKTKISENKELPPTFPPGWEVDKVNLENTNASLQTQITNMSTDMTDIDTQMRFIRSQLNKLKREKQLGLWKGTMIGLSIGIVIGCLAYAFFYPIFKQYFQ